MFLSFLKKIIEKKNLTQKEATAAMQAVMSGQVTPGVLASFLTALRMKGETADEIAGFALAMREAALPLHTKRENLVDTCGTGGDGMGGLNISTAAAFVVAGAGMPVAKHGNRAASSKSGSADVLEVLGVRVDCPSACMEDALNRVGLCFMFAPHFHPAMKFAMPTRKELGFRTVFNILGPLTNPAQANVQMIGVADSALVSTLPHVLKKMGHSGGLVVHTKGWDEITLAGPTQVGEMLGGKVRFYSLTHKDFGLPAVSVKHLVAGETADNARVISSILKGEAHPARPVVVANAAAVLWVAERSYGRKKYTLKEAVRRAQQAIDSGEAMKKLAALAEISHTLD